MLSPSESHDAGGACAEAQALVRAGRRREAIELLVARNRVRRDDEVESLLIRLRCEAFAGTEPGPGLPAWPPATPDLFPDAAGLPEIAPHELRAESLRSGIIRHGGLMVRGLVPQARIDQLVDDIDHAFTDYDAYHAKGADRPTATPWYVPFDFDRVSRVASAHHWVRAGGGVLTVESPRAAFDAFEMFDEVGLIEPIAGHLGERPVLSARKWTLRRVPPDSSTSWHQDGAFLGDGVRAVNVWIALSRCGDDAPSLDVVPRRIDEILPTGTEGALLDSAIGPPVVARAAKDAPIERPRFEAGDALLFDERFLHRTGVSDVMRRERYALESWFFAPSCFPAREAPVTV